MKQSILTPQNQPEDWLDQIINECNHYLIRYLNFLYNDDLILDVGANVGGFFLTWKNFSNNWILVEPSKYNCSEISKNLNNHKYQLINKAVDSKSGNIARLRKYIMNEGKEAPSGNFSINDFINPDNGHGWKGEYEEVETISFEDLVGDKKVGLLKVDCEGSEHDFLFNKNLKNIKYIVMELHNFLGVEKQQELCSWIEKTHKEAHSEGNGEDSHYIKYWVNNELY